MQQQREPDSEVTIGQQTGEDGPDPTEAGFNDTSDDDRSTSGGEVNEQEPSWRPGDEPGEEESAPAASQPGGGQNRQ